MNPSVTYPHVTTIRTKVGDDPSFLISKDAQGTKQCIPKKDFVVKILILQDQFTTEDELSVINY